MQELNFPEIFRAGPKTGNQNNSVLVNVIKSEGKRGVEVQTFMSLNCFTANKCIPS